MIFIYKQLKRPVAFSAVHNENMEVESHEETEVQPWFRMSRKNCDKILLGIKVHNVFKKLEGRSSGVPSTDRVPEDARN